MRFKRLKSLLFAAVSACGLLASPARAAGTLPLAMAQQVDINGQPLAFCVVNFFIAGTTSQPQVAFADFGLTQQLGSQVTCDQAGRVPMFWLADGLIHVRLSDANGNQIIDTTMQTLGPSSGGGGGGGTVDPTTIAQTGDVKFRLDSAPQAGWVIENGQTIGSATSGASQRANADTQSLFVYLWTNCAQPTSNRHCAVVGGLGASALADFNANKQITLSDMRSSLPIGRDCMGNATPCAGKLLASNVSSGGGDGVDTPFAFGGLANQTISHSIAQANLPNVNFNITDLGHVHPNNNAVSGSALASNSGTGLPVAVPIAASVNTQSATTGITVNSGGNSAAISQTFAVMNPFVLGTWYQKL